MHENNIRIRIGDLYFTIRQWQRTNSGAISASWWGGNYYGTEEGYLKVNIEGEDFSWDYIDYGWEAKKK